MVSPEQDAAREHGLPQILISIDFWLGYNAPSVLQPSWGAGRLVMEGLLQPTHLIIIFALLLIFFGGKKLPELGKGLGAGIKEFKDALKTGMNDTPADKKPEDKDQKN